MQLKQFFLPLLATYAISSENNGNLPFSSINDAKLAQLILPNIQPEVTQSSENDLTVDVESPKTPLQTVSQEKADAKDTESTEKLITIEELEKQGVNIIYKQLRTYTIDEQKYFELEVPGDMNQCGFFCFNTNRVSGMTKVLELAQTNDRVKDAVEKEIYRKFQNLDFSFCVEESPKKCIEQKGMLEEKLLSDNPDIDKEAVKVGILECEQLLIKASKLYVEHYIKVFGNFPLMLEVERDCENDNISLMDILAGAFGFGLEVYIQETKREDGSIDPEALKLYHKFDPKALNLEGIFPVKKIILTNVDKGDITAEKSKTEWRNHFNILAPLD